MATTWDRWSSATRDRERNGLLADWIASEVVPFNKFWSQRLDGRTIRRVNDLAAVPVADEAELAAVGGPGNPGLLLAPTEEQFKRHASRRELLGAARELRGAGPQQRRVVLLRRYQPVHVHEAGVAVVLANAYSRTDLDRLHLAGARLMEVLGLGPDDALVNAVPAGPSLHFWGLYHAGLAARITALHPRGVGQDLVASVARGLAMLPATVLAVPVAEAEALLAGLADRGVPTPRLRTVLTVGPPPDGELRARLAEAAAGLGAGEVRVQAVWAPETARALWGECRPPAADPPEATYGLHTYPDLEVVEVRDVARRSRAEAEQPGELVYTSLGWRGTVLIRHATGAWTSGLAEDVPCPSCGRTVPRLAPRVVDAAWQPRVLADGRVRRVDLRRALDVLTPQALDEVEARDWSLQAVDGQLVLGLDAPLRRREDAHELAARVATAVGVEPQVRLDPSTAAARPQLGEAGRP